MHVNTARYTGITQNHGTTAIIVHRQHQPQITTAPVQGNTSCAEAWRGKGCSIVCAFCCSDNSQLLLFLQCFITACRSLKTFDLQASKNLQSSAQNILNLFLSAAQPIQISSSGNPSTSKYEQCFALRFSSKVFIFYVLGALF